jgi:type VI protein secretion system component VasK
LSFAVNRQQIISVADQAHTLVEHPLVSDDQLTALHTLRNDAGRLQHHVSDGAPWYQRFGVDHNPQLLDAMLPWYGVANNRLIRDPANAALQQKLSTLANSAPNSVHNWLSGWPPTTAGRVCIRMGRQVLPTGWRCWLACCNVLALNFIPSAIAAVKLLWNGWQVTNRESP